MRARAWTWKVLVALAVGLWATLFLFDSWMERDGGVISRAAEVCEQPETHTVNPSSGAQTPLPTVRSTAVRRTAVEAVMSIALLRLRSLSSRFGKILRSLKHRVHSSIQGARSARLPSLPLHSSTVDIKKITSDYCEQSVDDLSLTAIQRERLLATHGSIHRLLASNQTLREMAKETHLEVTHHFVYRYFVATEWAPLYNLATYEDAIVATINWRHSFPIHRPPRAILFTAHPGVCYAGSHPDRHGRAVMYFQAGFLQPSAALQEAQRQLLMHTVERVERWANALGSGEFVLVADLGGLSLSSLPSASFLLQCVHTLKAHYPYRMSVVYLLHAPKAFALVFALIRPYIADKVRRRIRMSSLDEVASEIGVVELGRLQVPPAYWSEGYWQ